MVFKRFSNILKLNQGQSPISIGSVNYYPVIKSNSNGMIVRNLQVFNNSDQSCTIQIIRIDANATILFRNRKTLSSQEYCIIWNGFVYLEANSKMYARIISEDQNCSVDIYASVIDQTVGN